MSMEIAIGVGCRKGCSATSIEAIVRQALIAAPVAGQRALFTIADKKNEPGLAEAADRLGLDLIFLSRETLREKASVVSTRSAQAEAAFGVPSVAEAAALAGAGAGAVLVVRRVANEHATCAVAISWDIRL